MTRSSFWQHKNKGIEWKRNGLENHVVEKLGPESRSQEFWGNIVGRHIVAQEQRSLAVDCCERRIGPSLLLIDADVILHRSVCG
jgi:hypothetical protein